MRRFSLIAFAAALFAAPALAEKLTVEQLNAYMAVAPAAPEGWTRADRAGNYSSDRASTFSLTYTSADGSKRFLFTIIFSKENADQNRDLLKDARRRDMFGMTLEKIKGRDALAKKPDNKNKSMATYLVVIAESRSVSITESGGEIDRAILKAFLETADFDAIAKR